MEVTILNSSIFISFPTLKTTRLVLAKLDIQHLAALLPITGFKVPNPTKEDVQELLKKTEDIFGNQQGITWGMYHEKELIGTIGFYRGFEGEVGEVGYVLRNAFHGRGFMSEAMKTVLDFGFNTMELQGISAFTEESNLPSMKLLHRFGFHRTEHLHEKYRKFLLQQHDWQQRPHSPK